MFVTIVRMAALKCQRCGHCRSGHGPGSGLEVTVMAGAALPAELAAKQSRDEVIVPCGERYQTVDDFIAYQWHGASEP
jgi:hypothetical protein